MLPERSVFSIEVAYRLQIVKNFMRQTRQFKKPGLANLSFQTLVHIWAKVVIEIKILFFQPPIVS